MVFQGVKFVICMNYNLLQVVPPSSVMSLFSFGEKRSKDWSLLNNLSSSEEKAGKDVLDFTGKWAFYFS